MQSIKDEIAKNLLYYRRKSNLTQKDLAMRLGVKHNSISAWESGTNSIDTEVLFNICKILNVSVSEMFGILSDGFLLTAHEKMLISAYRKKPEEIQKIFDKILEIQDKQPEQPKIYKVAARSVDNHPAYEELTPEEAERLRNAPHEELPF